MQEISSTCSATEQLFSSCCCNPLHVVVSLLPLFLKKKIYIYIYIYVLYIWTEKNILKVEFLIKKTPSNIGLLLKTTRYHQRFWKICWKIFRFVHALFVLAIYMIYLFSFGYWKYLWVHALYFFLFLLRVYTQSLHALYISMFKSPFNLWKKIVQIYDLMEGLVFVFGLRSDFLSLNMIWFFFRIGYFSFCSRFDFLKQFCCHVSIKKEEQIKKFTCTTFHLTNQSSEPLIHHRIF